MAPRDLPITGFCSPLGSPPIPPVPVVGHAHHSASVSASLQSGRAVSYFMRIKYDEGADAGQVLSVQKGTRGQQELWGALCRRVGSLYPGSRAVIVTGHRQLGHQDGACSLQRGLGLCVRFPRAGSCASLTCGLKRLL